ncbi:MAG: WavE lipopolysaccharide synthesis [Bacteroidota bacterium]|jgi:hypothetical protein
MDKVMEDCTIIIQGRLEKECYEHYIKKFVNCSVVISTWSNNDIDFSNLPKNFKIVIAPLPVESGDQNINYQIVSTLNGLDLVKTKYCIKVRGDEFWTYPENIYQSIVSEPDKLHCSPVFFRAWQYAEYHMSDHIIAGKTENLITLFRSAKYNWENNRLNISKWKTDGNFNGYIHTHAPEERLTKSYLEAKEGNSFESIDGRELMKKHFQILNINYLKPYKIKANLFKVEFRDNFIPEQNYSISTIDQLFSDEPYKI